MKNYRVHPTHWLIFTQVDAAAKIDAKRKLPKGQQTLAFKPAKKATRVSPPPAPVTVTPPSPPELPTPSAFGAYAFAE